MFGKKDSDSNQTTQTPNQPKSHNDEVYIMPERFHPRISGGSMKFLVITLFVLVLLGLSAGIYFGYDWLQNRNSSQLSQNSNQTGSSVNNNSVDNSNSSTNINSSLESLINSQEEIDEETATTTNENTEEKDPESLIPPTLSSDTDRDDLTDLEEILFGSSPSRPDTDGDGYTDGQEVSAGYNPAVPGSDEASKLKNSNAIQIVETSFASNNFKFMSIGAWQAVANESLHQVLVNTDTGEIIRVSIRRNPERISATNWYLDSHPEVSLSQLKSVNINGLSGIYSPSRLKLHLTNANRTDFYDFEYIMTDDNSDFRYPNIFEMIAKTFELTPDKPVDGSDISSWKTYKNQNLGFEIKYPGNWVYEEMGTVIAFGTPESKSGGYIWQLAYLTDKSMDDDAADIGSQFSDRQESREEIDFSDGLRGTMVTVTTSENPDWVSKNLYFDVGGSLYVVRNGAIVNNLFSQFYNSLKF